MICIMWYIWQKSSFRWNWLIFMNVDDSIWTIMKSYAFYHDNPWTYMDVHGLPWPNSAGYMYLPHHWFDLCLFRNKDKASDSLSINTCQNKAVTNLQCLMDPFQDSNLLAWLLLYVSSGIITFSLYNAGKHGKTLWYWDECIRKNLLNARWIK